MKNICGLIILSSILSCVAPAQEIELNTVLMESTFKIQGIAKIDPKLSSIGTVFFIGRPTKHKTESYYVLVTAAHVLDDISGDTATIFLREPITKGFFKRLPYTFSIRDKGRNLYTRHPTADVAVMYFQMPIKDPFAILDDTFLTTDERIKELELHPGDELICLGYPLGAEANDMGFPILRSGRIASYPLLPTKVRGSFLFDFMVFPGNSGGPVYFAYETRRIGPAIKYGGLMGIIGLLSQQASMGNEPLKIGSVVPATFIREAIELLPPQD